MVTAPQPAARLAVIHDPPLDGPSNMGRDEHLLYSEALRPAALRLYGWSPPTISLGYFQGFDEIARLPADVRSLAVVRRPTGGGAILHDREVTYCLVVDASLTVGRAAPTVLYRLVHECWRDALAQTGTQSELAPDHMPLPSPRSGPFFCFEKPGKTDLLIGTQKLLGSAQRRIPGRVLQHGSLLLAQRYAAHPGVDLGEPPGEIVQGWLGDFVARLAAALELSPFEHQWEPAELLDAAARRERFAADDWTRLR